MDFTGDANSVDAGIENTYTGGKAARRRGLYFASILFGLISLAVYIRQ